MYAMSIAEGIGSKQSFDSMPSPADSSRINTPSSISSCPSPSTPYYSAPHFHSHSHSGSSSSLQSPTPVASPLLGNSAFYTTLDYFTHRDSRSSSSHLTVPSRQMKMPPADATLSQSSRGGADSDTSSRYSSLSGIGRAVMGLDLASPLAPPVLGSSKSQHGHSPSIVLGSAVCYESPETPAMPHHPRATMHYESPMVNFSRPIHSQPHSQQVVCLDSPVPPSPSPSVSRDHFSPSAVSHLSSAVTTLSAGSDLTQASQAVILQARRIQLQASMPLVASTVDSSSPLVPSPDFSASPPSRTFEPADGQGELELEVQVQKDSECPLESPGQISPFNYPPSSSLPRTIDTYYAEAQRLSDSMPKGVFGVSTQRVRRYRSPRFSPETDSSGPYTPRETPPIDASSGKRPPPTTEDQEQRTWPQATETRGLGIDRVQQGAHGWTLIQPSLLNNVSPASPYVANEKAEAESHGISGLHTGRRIDFKVPPPPHTTPVRETSVSFVACPTSPTRNTPAPTSSAILEGELRFPIPVPAPAPADVRTTVHSEADEVLLDDGARSENPTAWPEDSEIVATALILQDYTDSPPRISNPLNESTSSSSTQSTTFEFKSWLGPAPLNRPVPMPQTVCDLRNLRLAADWAMHGYEGTTSASASVSVNAKVSPTGPAAHAIEEASPSAPTSFTSKPTSTASPHTKSSSQDSAASSYKLSASGSQTSLASSRTSSSSPRKIKRKAAPPLDPETMGHYQDADADTSATLPIPVMTYTTAPLVPIPRCSSGSAAALQSPRTASSGEVPIVHVHRGLRIIHPTDLPANNKVGPSAGYMTHAQCVAFEEQKTRDNLAKAERQRNKKGTFARLFKS